MDDPGQLSEYGKILIMLLVGIFFVCATILIARIISPKRPNPIKLSTYECGEEALGSAWVQFNPRFYVIALVFLLFDVELIFIFPWATVFGQAEYIMADSRWGWFTMVEMGIFIAILVLGLVYVWVRGDLSWVTPTHQRPVVEVNIPSSAYANLNQKTYKVRDYKEKGADISAEMQPTQVSPKAGFTPRFKKPDTA